MGLSGRKEKQRIGADPRNLTWADNAAKFGHSYLSKLGWDSSKGLGAEGDGRTSHIKVAQKLNVLGIGAGAAQTKGPDGIAWKQNRDFEALLARLNAQEPESTVAKDVEELKADEVAAISETESTEGKTSKREKRKEEDEPDKRSKKKRRTEDGAVEVDSEKEKRKKEKKDKKKKEKRKSSDESSRNASPSNSDKVTETSHQSSTNETSEKIESLKTYVPRPMAHRARFLASKRLAITNSTAISEILGISSSNASPSSTPTPYPPSTEPGSLLNSGTATPAIPEELKMEQLTTATKSVADYFKEKLAARSSARSSGPNTPISTDEKESSSQKVDEKEERPRFFGLGMRSSFVVTNTNQESETRTGLGASRLSNNLASMFAKAAPAIAPISEESPTESVQKTEKKKKKSSKADDGKDTEGDITVDAVKSKDKSDKKKKKKKEKD